MTRDVYHDTHRRRYARYDIDDRPGADFEPCHKAGHVDGCPGGAGGDHELRDGWIAYEDARGDLIEAEVA